MYDEREYQVDTVRHWYRHIKRGDCNPLVALPTGSGKSVILAMLLHAYLKDHPHNEVLILTHTQEIIKQDVKILRDFLPDYDVGVYSAGLDEKNKTQVTIGGIQSVINAVDKFKWVNLIIIDEAHAVNHKATGNYRKFLDQTHGVVAGMSATVYRMGHGYLHVGKGVLFDKLSYDLTSTVKFNKLVKDGYLCKLISVAPDTQLDSSQVKKTAGDFNLKQLAITHDKESITKAAVLEAKKYGKNYKKWLVFAIDIDHCEHINLCLNRNGIRAAVLHSRMSADRDAVLAAYKAGNIQALVSVGMVTTGFDEPGIDLILLLRPTLSAVLHVQMVGRGLRMAPGKDHCLVLDYAGNTAELGPINNVKIPKKRKEGKGEAPTKKCPKCKTITHPLAKFCDSCGHEFTFKTRLQTTASSAKIVDGQVVPDKGPTWSKVHAVDYNIHLKAGSPPSLKVTYFCGLRTFNEWICPQHGGYPGRKGRHMLTMRGYRGEMNTRDAFAAAEALKKPTHILVDASAKYPDITNARFE